MKNIKQQQKSKAVEIEKTIYQEFLENIDYLCDVQLNFIYPRVHNKEDYPIGTNWDKLILESKTGAEKVLYALASIDIELRTIDMKNKNNLSALYVRKDNRIGLRLANSTDTTKIKQFTTVEHVIAFINEIEKSKKFSKKAKRQALKHSVRFHGHHINEINNDDRFSNVQLKIDLKHQAHHKPKPKPKQDSYTYINKKAEKPSIPAVVKSLEKNKQMKKYNKRL